VTKALHRLAVVLLLGGCAAPQVPDGLERSELVQLPDSWDHTALPEEVVDGWIERFGDERLTELVELAQVNNPNLKTAYSNILRAEALLRQTSAGLRPSANTQLSYDWNGRLDGDSSPDTSQFFLTFNYLLDVWGGTRASIDAASADFESVWLNYQFAQLSLAAAVAKAYFLAIESELQVEINKANVDSLIRISEIVELQFREGAVTQQDVNLAMSDVASAESRLITSEQTARNARRILNLILGAYPNDDVVVGTALPSRPSIPAAGVPAALLERRPDIVAAEQSVAAAFNRVHVAKVARFPRISLTGNLGGISTDLNELFQSDRLSWSIGPSVGVPLYQGGALAAQVDAASASQQGAIASYASQALDALSEVEIALDSNQTLAAQQERIQVSYETARNANRLAQLRYENGDISLVDLIEIQRREFSRRSELTTNLRRQLDARIDLFLALGGDWQSQSP
jgi:NodT family efflux transporter outer membrane factor (OMF) lipoprotein